MPFPWEGLIILALLFIIPFLLYFFFKEWLPDYVRKIRNEKGDNEQ